MTFFRKTWRVTVGTLRISAPIRVAFEIERSVHSRPGKASVRIWNLTREHQSQIEQIETAQVVVEAGYEDDRGLGQIFRGELFRARGRGSPPGIRTEADTVDAVTLVEARDGGREFQQARISRSFEPRVSVTTVLQALADALDVGPGNLSEVAAVAELEAGGSTYPEGIVLSGQASGELTRILRGLGLRWSVQHGALQILRRGEALQTQAVRLADETGLVGSPEVGSHGRIKATSLLTSELWPGRVVLLESARVRGRYTCRAVKYSGDSHGQQWYAECDLAPAGTTP